MFDFQCYSVCVVECVIPSEDGHLLVRLDLETFVDDPFGDLLDWLGFGELLSHGHITVQILALTCNL